VAFALPLAIYLLAIRNGMPENEVRALTFFSLVTAIIALIFVNRSFRASLSSALLRPNRALIVVLIAVGSILALSLLWPFARNLFRFGPLHSDDLAVVLGAGFAVMAMLEAIKYAGKRKALRPSG
jgi:Ca2+-transporting ATPase